MKLVFDTIDTIHDNLYISFDGVNYNSYSKEDILANGIELTPELCPDLSKIVIKSSAAKKVSFTVSKKFTVSPPFLIKDNLSFTFKATSDITQSVRLRYMGNLSLFQNALLSKNRLFVAAGYTGYITTSTDSENWSEPIQVGTEDWNCTCHGNSLFVIGGDKGYITTSPNGLSWSTPIQVGTEDWNSAIFAKGMFILVGNNGNIATSTNGSTWAITTISGNSNLQSIAYGLNTFVIVGLDKTILTSTDGLSWNTITNTETSITAFYGVVFGGGIFLILCNGGYAKRSTDTITWSDATPIGTHSLYGINYANSMFYASGEEGFTYKSFDGITWSDPMVKGDTYWRNMSYENISFSNNVAPFSEYICGEEISSFECSDPTALEDTLEDVLLLEYTNLTANTTTMIYIRKGTFENTEVFSNPLANKAVICNNHFNETSYYWCFD